MLSVTCLPHPQEQAGAGLSGRAERLRYRAVVIVIHRHLYFLSPRAEENGLRRGNIPLPILFYYNPIKLYCQAFFHTIWIISDFLHIPQSHTNPFRQIYNNAHIPSVNPAHIRMFRICYLYILSHNKAATEFVIRFQNNTMRIFFVKFLYMIASLQKVNGIFTQFIDGFYLFFCAPHEIRCFA